MYTIVCVCQSPADRYGCYTVYTVNTPFRTAGRCAICIHYLLKRYHMRAEPAIMKGTGPLRAFNQIPCGTGTAESRLRGDRPGFDLRNVFQFPCCEGRIHLFALLRVSQSSDSGRWTPPVTHTARIDHVLPRCVGSVKGMDEPMTHDDRPTLRRRVRGPTNFREERVSEFPRIIIWPARGGR